MKTILLVEDDPDIRKLVGVVLRKEGYEVIEAEHGEQALEVLGEMRGNPCLVLLDLMMPVMSGPELLKVLHDTHRLAALPVVVLSAGGEPSDAPQAQHFVRKPAAPGVLLALVREFCGSPAE
ncbi:MAG TPA: response regulator [Polyangiales bacterium]|nr:response regulator [Polyangiales bacterium]